jgi:hypothetical protein
MMVVTPRRFCKSQRLVEQQQPRRGRQRAGQRNALLLTARQLRRIFVVLAGQPHQLQKLAHARVDIGLGLLAVFQPVGDVADDGEVGKQRIGLEHDAEIALRRRQVGNVAAPLRDLPVGLQFQPGDGAQQGRLATARRAQEADELALFDLDGDIVQRAEVAEILDYVLDPQIRTAGLNICRHGASRGLA